jgi:hypothetical protein
MGKGISKHQVKAPDYSRAAPLPKFVRTGYLLR